MDIPEHSVDDNRVPFIVYEGTVARFERTIRRLIILIGITILLLFASNAIWIYEWNQYDYEDVVVDSQDGGNANYLEAGMNGVINNGKCKCNFRFLDGNFYHKRHYPKYFRDG